MIYLAACLGQSEEGHGRYLILRNCRDPSAFRQLANCAAATIASAVGSLPGRARVSFDVQDSSSLSRPLPQLPIKMIEQGGMSPRASPPHIGVQSSTAAQEALASRQHCDPSKVVLKAPASLVPHSGSDCGGGRGAGGLCSGITSDRCDEEAELEEERNLLEAHYRVSVTSSVRLGGATDTLDSALIAAMRRAPLGSVWDAGNPVAAILARRWAVPGLLGIAVAASTGIGAMPPPPGEGGLMLCSQLRFTALQTRVGTVPATPGIMDVGLLRGGFAPILTSRRSGERVVAGASLTVKYVEAVEADGWWFTTSALQPFTEDPARFVAECSADFVGSEWRPLGASTVSWAWSGRPVFDTSGSAKFEVPLARGEIVNFDMRPPWAWAAAGHAWQALYVSLALAMAALSAAQRPLLARYAMVLQQFTDAVMCAVVAVMHIYNVHWGLAFVTIGLGAHSAGYAMVFLKAQNRLLHYCFFVGVTGLIILAVHYALLLPSDGTKWPGPAAGSFFENRGGLWSIGIIYAACFGFTHRRYDRTRARNMVADDEKAYGECWAAISDSEAVGRLRAATDDLHLRVCSATALHAAAAAAANASFTVTLRGKGGISRIRQLSRRQRSTNVSDGKIDGISRPGYDEGELIGPPVRDLDLLFAQAKGLLPHLRSKVSI